MTVEIKSVNHRYCETFVRISRSYMQIEDILRNYIQKNIFRGKIEIAVNIEKTGDSESRTLRLNDGSFERVYYDSKRRRGKIFSCERRFRGFDIKDAGGFAKRKRRA